MNELIGKLGQLVHEKWQDAGRAPEAFPEVASNALAALAPAGKIEPREIIDWVHHGENFPNQMDLGAQFGEPPVTIYVAEDFHIDVYFWLDSTTEIHEHSFCGAFTLLEGSSIQGIYDFEERDRLDDSLRIGDLDLRETRYLTKGGIQTILPGSRFIHNVIHLDRPTVTLLVRSSCPEIDRQFNFLRPNLSLLAFRDCPPQLIRRLQFLEMMRKIDVSQFFQQTKRVVEELGPGDCAQLILKLIPLFDKEKANIANLINELFYSQPALVEVLVPALKEMNFNQFQMNLRKAVVDPEQRFLCAALSLHADLDAFLEEVRRRFPTEEPVSKICALLKAMVALPGVDLGFEWSTETEGALHTYLTAPGPVDSSAGELGTASRVQPFSKIFRFGAKPVRQMASVGTDPA